MAKQLEGRSSRGVDITKSCRQIDIYSVECDKRVALLWGYAKNGLIEIDDAVLLDFLSFVRVTGEVEYHRGQDR